LKVKTKARTKELTLKAKDRTKDLAAERTQGLYMQDLHFESTVEERQIINRYNWAYSNNCQTKQQKEIKCIFIAHQLLAHTVYSQTV